MRIAIVRLSSLGDIIFCMSCLQLIRRHLPQARVTWVADSKFADILDYNPDLEQVVKLDLKGVKRRPSCAAALGEYRKLKEAGEFDLAIDLHGMLKSALVAACLSRQRAGFHRSVAKEPLATLWYGDCFRIPREGFAVSRFSQLAAAALGFPFSEEELKEKKPYLFHGEADALAVAPLFSREKKNVILVPGSSAGYKNYPKEKYLRITKGLDAQFLVCHGGAREREVGEYLAGNSGSVTLLPTLTLNQLKAAVSRADLVIGGDTGPTHMAWACNTPSITLYGATPANCVYPGPLSRAVTSGSRVNLLRPDRNDLSLRAIREEAVIALAEELLS
jgi:heptosyltransferase-1